MRRGDVLAAVHAIGKYDLHSDPECQEGTPLGDAYSKGWNAALIEVLGRLKALGAIKEKVL